jgi:hypothetical protein
VRHLNKEAQSITFYASINNNRFNAMENQEHGAKNIVALEHRITNKNN